MPSPWILAILYYRSVFLKPRSGLNMMVHFLASIFVVGRGWWFFFWKKIKDGFWSTATGGTGCWGYETSAKLLAEFGVWSIASCFAASPGYWKWLSLLPLLTYYWNLIDTCCRWFMYRQQVLETLFFSFNHHQSLLKSITIKTADVLFQLKCDHDYLDRSALDIYILSHSLQDRDSPVENRWISDYSKSTHWNYSNFFLREIRHRSQVVTSIGEARTEGANHSIYHGRGSGDAKNGRVFFTSRARFLPQFIFSTSWICHQSASSWCIQIDSCKFMAGKIMWNLMNQ